MTEERRIRPRGEVEEGYLNRLAENWPEPRDQLHFGGWEATYQMVEKLQLQEAEHVLDICCGEGSTACWLADTYRIRVTGIDILEKAIIVARTRARVKELEDLVSFKPADVFDLPFQDASFDVIYGQDPDGVAHKDRVDAFKECRRVLIPKGRFGIQHWLPHSGTSSKDLKRFEEITQGNEYGYMQRLSVDDYISDLEDAGFKDIAIEDLSDMYQDHVLRMDAVAKEAGRKLDEWHATFLEMSQNGVKIGVRIRAHRD
jgi:ubiquinone/menaquinone biosynthesis C-methylase UbiE